jgi:molybdopterin molybdotransferase
MISVDEALEFILKQIEPGAAEKVTILDALDRVLAEDIYSDVNVPPFDNSTMDGYAVRAVDTVNASRENPQSLRVVADLAAGYTTEVVVRPGTAIRIMTGAPIPMGADSVVRFEETSEGNNGDRVSRRINVFKAVVAGENVRSAGEDISLGELVLLKGQVIRPQEIGVLASLGKSQVQVIRRPQVAILATGDELVGIDEKVTPGKIRNSNEYSNAALVRRYGGIPIMLGIARDDKTELEAKIREGLDRGADLFLTSGGVSVGDYDMVKDVLASEGEVLFWQVRMKPGKPLAFGQVRGVPLIGLPGNPVAAMVSFEQFVRPCMLKMQGKTHLHKPTVKAILTETVTSGGWRSFKRVVVETRNGHRYATIARPRGSSNLTSMARANGLAVISEGVSRVEAGQEVEVQMLDWSGDVLL